MTSEWRTSAVADLQSLVEIIQIADADKLVGVITDDLVAFLRTLLQEANIVHETVALLPILNQIGAIEEERIEESLSKLTSLLRTAIKNAKAKHGAGKRVRVLFRLDERLARASVSCWSNHAM